MPSKISKNQMIHHASKVHAENEDIAWAHAERGIPYSQGQTAVGADHNTSSNKIKSSKTSSASNSENNRKDTNKNDSSTSSGNSCWCCQKLTNLILGIAIVIGVGVGIAAFMDHTNVLDGRNGFGPGLPPRDITMEELQQHDTADDCWVIYYGDVYDMTEYAKRHPGGASIITKLAGMDATEAYENFHSQGLLKTVMGTKIGPLVASTGATDTTGTTGTTGAPVVDKPCSTTATSMSKALQEVSMEELQRHNTANDCWVIYDGVVYDMTDYAKRHPGGSSIITKYAGTDATAAYRQFHKLSLLNTVRNTKVGPLEGGGTTGCNTGNGTPPSNTITYPEPESPSSNSSD